jgi:hypothetical protein
LQNQEGTKDQNKGRRKENWERKAEGRRRRKRYK